MRTELLGIFVAALGGAAVGAERQWSGHASGKHPRLGGIRTLTLLGGVAGIAGWLTTQHLVGFAIVLASGAVALVVAGYAAASRHDVDATTEAASLVVVGAGLAAGAGWLALASGVIAISTLLLVEKSRLHALVGSIDDEELRAAARFGVMAIVILPLLPDGPFGPWGGIRPRELWLLVLLFSGLSFAGYLAARIFGTGHGYPLAGLLGGIISSTSVTMTFARLSRREERLSGPLALGAVAACTMLFPRVVIATAVLNPSVARALVPYLAAPFVVGLLTVAFWWRTVSGVTQPRMKPSNPLQIGPALQMALTFQLVPPLVQFARRFFGQRGLVMSGALLGLTDVDALTISLAKMPALGVAPAEAAQVIAIGILANCLLKTALAVTLGTRQVRYVGSAAITAMAIAIAIAVGVMR